MFRLKTLFSALVFATLILCIANLAYAQTTSATVYLATDKGDGEKAGTVTITDIPDGKGSTGAQTAVSITTDLQGLPPGMHGFHIHEKGDCSPMAKDGKMGSAMAAGGHYDPDKTGKHLGPGGGGHRGDLPVLTVQPDGTAKVTMQVKGLTAEELRNRSVMIHAGGDNYSDIPALLGGGGARIACGVFK